MLWRGGRESDNIDDRRGLGARGLGLGGLLIGAIMVYVLGGNPVAYLLQNAGYVSTGTSQPAPQEQEQKSFASVVLGYTEDVWSDQFAASGRTYQAPVMVLYRGIVDSACGNASAAAGPFYCPVDRKVYLDLGFFDELSRRLGAKGDAAAAYVIAHEVGHHVQRLLGITSAVTRAQNENPSERNALSVQLELQADCLAGAWTRQIEVKKRVIEPGDIGDAMNAASAVGDDRLQRRSRGTVIPDSFTHGTSAQRVGAFRQGYEGGGLGSCLGG